MTKNGPLADDPNIRHCLEIQERWDAKNGEIRQATEQMERLTQRQDRLRKNIDVAGNDEQSNRWRADLGRAEDQLVQLEEQTIPALQKEAEAIEAELWQAVRSLSAEWMA